MFCFVFRGDWFEEVSVGVEWGDSSIGERNEPNWVSSVLSWWVCFGISVTICVFFLLRLFFAFIFWWLQLVSCHCVCMCGVSIWVFFYCFCFCYALVDVYYYYYLLFRFETSANAKKKYHNVWRWSRDSWVGWNSNICGPFFSPSSFHSFFLLPFLFLRISDSITVSSIRLCCIILNPKTRKFWATTYETCM